MPFVTWFFLIVPPILLLALEVIYFCRSDSNNDRGL